MKTRIISGLCMVPLLVLVYLGGYFITALCIIIGFMGVNELFNGFNAMGVKPSRAIAYGAMAVLYVVGGLFPTNHEYIIGWLVGSVMACSVYMLKINERRIEDALGTMLGIIYVVFFSYHVVLVDRLEIYGAMIWLVLLPAFCTDIFAYFTGVLFGKHKLCPYLSPKKTVEGAVGGIVGSVVCCGLFGRFLFPILNGIYSIVLPDMTIHCIVIGLIGSVMAQCGDLTASAYKRKMGIKDYGSLIPGHGGVMDRFDSVLFTAPMVYYYVVLVLM